MQARHFFKALTISIGALLGTHAIAAAPESLLISSKMTDRNGTVVMSAEVFTGDDIQSRVERTETFTFLSKRSVTKGGRVIALDPMEYKTGITLNLKPYRNVGGKRLVSIDGEVVKFLGFEVLDESTGLKAPTTSTTGFSSTGVVVDDKVEFQVGTCNGSESKPVTCEYTLTLDIKTL